MIIIWQGRQTPVDQYGILDWRISQNQSGTVTINGTIAATAPNATSTLQGTVKVQGTIAATAQPANSNLAGKVLVQGALTPTAPNATSVLQGTVQSNTRTGNLVATAPNATSDLEGSSGNAGGIPRGRIKRKHSKRYEFQIGNVTLIAPSVAELEGKLAAYRAAHPGDKNLAETEPIEAPVQPLRAAAREPASALPQLPRAADAPAPSRQYPQLPLSLPGGLLPGADRLVAERLTTERELALAVQAALQAEEDDDMEALRMIIEMAA